MHNRAHPSRRVPSSHLGSKRDQRRCGSGSQPREARPELKLCSCIWLALLMPPKETFRPLLIKLISQLVFSFDFCIFTRKSTCLCENKFTFSSYPWGNKIYDNPHHKSCLAYAYEPPWQQNSLLNHPPSTLLTSHLFTLLGSLSTGSL